MSKNFYDTRAAISFKLSSLAYSLCVKLDAYTSRCIEKANARRKALHQKAIEGAETALWRAVQAEEGLGTKHAAERAAARSEVLQAEQSLCELDASYVAQHMDTKLVKVYDAN